jgi:hypothetical protein
VPPERTADGREIVRNRFGAFTREGGFLEMYVTEEERWTRVERLFAKPRGGQGRVTMDWSVWRA